MVESGVFDLKKLVEVVRSNVGDGGIRVEGGIRMSCIDTGGSPLEAEVTLFRVDKLWFKKDVMVDIAGITVNVGVCWEANSRLEQGRWQRWGWHVLFGDTSLVWLPRFRFASFEPVETVSTQK